MRYKTCVIYTNYLTSLQSGHHVWISQRWDTPLRLECIQTV